MTAVDVLDLPMTHNDADAKNVREYLKELLKTLWIEDENFSSKRPFGNSGWQFEVHSALINGGAVKSDGGSYDEVAANELILKAIEAL
jgi:hypothetical protein